MRALIVAAALAAAVRAAAVRLEVGYAEGLPGDEVTVAVALESQGAAVAATQNDVGFDADAPVAMTAAGGPDCEPNPAIGKEQSAFAFLPPGCAGDGSCTAMRAVVISFANVDPIPDGVLYTCQVALAPDAAAAAHFLPCSDAFVSTPSGIGFRVPCRGGEVLLPGGTPRVPPPPTARPTPTPTPARTGLPTPTTPPPTRVPAVRIEIGDVDTDPGVVVVDVVLRTDGFAVAGAQNDVYFPSVARIPATATGRPDCWPNPAIDKSATTFAFLPPGCTLGDCSGVRALVLSLENVAPIPDGAVLYSCQLAVGLLRGSETLRCGDPQASDPRGAALVTECRDGAVRGFAALPTEAVTPSRTLSPTATPSDGEVRTRKPTSTPAGPRTETPAANDGGGEPPGASGDSDDGCAVGAASPGDASGLLLLPAALLWLVRRRAS